MGIRLGLGRRFLEQTERMMIMSPGSNIPLYGFCEVCLFQS